MTNIISKKRDFNGSNSDSPFLEIDEEEYHPISKVPTLSVHKCGLEAFHCQTQCMRCCQRGDEGCCQKENCKTYLRLFFGGIIFGVSRVLACEEAWEHLVIQCTIGYAMKIKKKKMFKSKHLVFAHFSTKTGDFFGIDGKIPMFCHKYFLKSKM